MKWIAMSERKPTAEDANEIGQVLYRWGDCGTMSAHWEAHESASCVTHFARLRDIELPPPPPVMPERLEFVKLKPGENLGECGIALHNLDGYACRANPNAMYTNYTLYRRVEPGKRIVLEVVDFREPKEGEWIIARDKTFILTANDNYSVNAPRTILRVVEGEEYLK